MVHRINIFLVLLSLCIIQFTYGQEMLTVPRIALGKVTAPELNELSGLISSRTHPNCYWVHNDSGDKARIFLIDQKGKLLKILNLSGIVAVDMEDIAWMNIHGKSFLVLADIGDNRGLRKNIKLYMLEEPQFDLLDGLEQDLNKDKMVVKTLRFDDKAKDAEALFIDPLTHGCYVISKREFQSTLYFSDIFNLDKDTDTLTPMAKFPFTFVTAADIASDGSQILVKNLENIYYWKRGYNETIVQAMIKPFVRLSYQSEPQGEAIGFDVEGKHFFTISERPFGLESYLYQYNLNHKSN